MRDLREQIALYAAYPLHMLIHGETGTGKELVAQSLHARSKRADGPFMPVDCSTLRDSLFESQLFGHVRGSFTGAERETLGFIRAADGGTLFLDEIGELPLDLQAKLLRCVQEGEVIPVGATAPVKVNFRIIAATHRDLAAMVEQGTFRHDLYYRLRQKELTLPPLRQRQEDIPQLCEHLLQRIATQFEEAPRKLSEEALVWICKQPLMGNVRQLHSILGEAHIEAQDGVIYLHHLPGYDHQNEWHGQEGQRVGSVWDFELLQKNHIEAALLEVGGCQAAAARLLNIDRRRVYRMVSRYKLQHLVKRRIT